MHTEVKRGSKHKKIPVLGNIMSIFTGVGNSRMLRCWLLVNRVTVKGEGLQEVFLNLLA